MSRLIFLSILTALALGLPVQAQSTTTGLVNVKLPRDARLYVDDVFCPLPGELRSFETPPLDPGRRYYYTLKVEITVDGKPIRASKQAIVQAGRTTDTDFGDRKAIVADAAATTDPMKKVESDTPPMLPLSPPPNPALASIKDGFLMLTRPVFVIEDAFEKRQRTVDGKIEEITVTVKKIVSKPVKEQIKLDGVKACDAANKPIAADRLTAMLEKETVVYILGGDTVDPFYQRTLKDGAIFLALSAGPAPRRP